MVAAAAAWFLPDNDNRTYTTAIGEQRTVRLPDGSLLTLNTRSRARVQFSQDARRIDLLEGDALFDIVRDPVRPFRVAAGSAMIQVLGTQFNVQRRANKTRVTVLDGRVQITTQPRETESHRPEPVKDSAPLLLGAGDEASVTGDGEVLKQVQPDVETALAWRERRLVFYGTPLAEVVAEFNRYNERQIRLQSDALAQRRISGVFHADDPGTILKFLVDEPALTIDQRPDAIIIGER
jgi:transmembrane sensor